MELRLKLQNLDALGLLTFSVNMTELSCGV